MTDKGDDHRIAGRNAIGKPVLRGSELISD
jgi:hypothetical protein